MAELGVGYLSIVPETSKIAPGVKSALGGAEKHASASGKSMGSKMSSALSKSVKVGAAGAAASAAGVLGTAFAKGFKRLDAMDKAEAKLRGLGKFAPEIARIKESMSAAVTGTAFGLDEAANSAAKLGAVGVKTGEELDRTLTLTADIAAQAGTNMDDVSSIMAKIKGAGKVTGETLAQLDDRATGAGAALAKHLNVSIDEMRDKVSKGQVSFEEFQEAMESHLGGAAQRTGETFQGAFDNMKSALGRFGEMLLKPAFAAGPGVFGKITEGVDGAKKALEPFVDQLAAKVGPAVENFFKRVDEMWAKLKGDPEAQNRLDKLKEVFSSLMGAATALAPPLGQLAKQLGEAAGKISVATWDALIGVLNAAAPILTDVVAPALENIAKFAGENEGAVTALVGAFAGFKTAENAIKPVKGVFNDVKGAITGVKDTVDGVRDKFNTVKDGVQIFGTAAKEAMGAKDKFVAFSEAIHGVGKATKLATGIQAAFNTVMALNPIVLIVAAVAALVAGLVLFFTKTETGKRIWGQFTDKLRSGVEKAKELWDSFTGKISSGVDKVKGLFDDVKTAVGEIFTAIKGGDDGYGALSKLIGEDRAKTVMDTITNVQNFIQGLKGKISSFGEAVGGILSTLGEGFSKTWDVIKTIFFAPFQVALDVLAGAVLIIKDVFTGNFGHIKDVLAAVWSNIKEHTFGAMTRALGELGDWFAQTWDKVKASATEWAAAMRVKATELKDKFFEFIRDKVNALKQWFEDMREKVVQAVTQLAVKLVLKKRELKAKFFEALHQAVDNAKTKFGEFKEHVVAKVTEVADNIKSFPGKIKDWFADAGQWLINAGRNMIDGLWNGIKGKWQDVQNWAASHLHLSIGGQATGGVAYATGGLAAYAGGARHSGYQLPTTGPGTDRTDGFLAFNQRGYPIARLDAGEWVINANSSKRYAKELAAINAGAFPKLPGYADGGLVAKTSQEIKDALSGVGHPYIFGGWSMAGTDCSGAVSMSVNAFRGLPILHSRTATGAEGSWLEAKGFTRGKGSAGDFIAAYKNGGPGGGHTAAQLPDGTFVESGGSTGQGLTIGGKAGPLENRGFTDWYHAPGGDNAASALGAAVSAGVAEGLSANSASTAGSSAGSTQVSWGSAQSLFDEIYKTHYAPKGFVPEPVVPTSTTGSVPKDSDPQYGTPLKEGAATWGPEFFVREITRSAKEHALDARAAAIGVATALVESGNPLKMYANAKVPESLRFRHDAVGSDYDSIGLFQQRQAGWGTVKNRMTPNESADMFFDRLVKFNWQAMDPGAAAQKVQVSAFPDRYGKQMSKAAELVKSFGVFDTGGILPHRGLAMNLSGTPEVIINGPQLNAINNLATNVGALVPALQRVVYTGQYEGTDATRAAGLFEDDPMVDWAANIHDQLRNLGGDWLAQTELVRDAERGLWQTRQQTANDLKAIETKEQELADLRRELAEMNADSGGMSVASARKLEDAEEALRRARESGKPDRVADAEKRLQRAREDAEAQMDKSGAKNASKVKSQLKKIEKAEAELAGVRQRSAEASAKLAAAEHTVVAARIKAAADIAQQVVNAFQQGADAAAKFVDGMVATQTQVAQLQQQITSLRMQQVNSSINAARLRVKAQQAEANLTRSKLAGAVKIAQAEANLAKARQDTVVWGKAGVDALAEATRVFYEGNTYELNTFSGAAAGFFSEQHTQMQGLADAATEHGDTIAAAQWEVEKARAEALLAEEQAQMDAADAAQDAADAVLEQQMNVELLRQATANLGAQARDFYGMTQQEATGAKRGMSGISRFFGGLAQVIGGGAMALATGGLGAVPGLLMAGKGIVDMVGGGADAWNNRKDIKKAWDGSSTGEKVALVAGTVGQVGLTAGGAYLGTVGGMGPAAIQAGAQLGGAFNQTLLGSVGEVRRSRNERHQLDQQSRQEALKAEFELKKAQRAQAKAERDLNRLRKLDALQAKVNYADLKAQAEKAETPELKEALTKAAEAEQERADKLFAQTAQQAQDVAAIRNYLDGDIKKAETRTRETGGRSLPDQKVTVQVGEGDAFSSTGLGAIMRGLNAALRNVELDVQEVKKAKKPTGLDVVRASR